MGDFAGAVLKYVRRHPVPRLTIAGGFGKLSKLAQGHLDLHSGRSQVDLPALAALARPLGGDDLAEQIAAGTTALHALQLARAAGVDLGAAVAAAALVTCRDVLRGSTVAVDVVVVDRAGVVVGRAGHEGPDGPAASAARGRSGE